MRLSSLTLASFCFLTWACATPIGSDAGDAAGSGGAASGSGGVGMGGGLIGTGGGLVGTGGGLIGTGGASSGGAATGGSASGGAPSGGAATGGGTATGGSSGVCSAAWTQKVYATAGLRATLDGIEYEVCYYTEANPSTTATTTCQGAPWRIIGPCPK